MNLIYFIIRFKFKVTTVTFQHVLCPTMKYLVPRGLERKRRKVNIIYNKKGETIMLSRNGGILEM